MSAKIGDTDPMSDSGINEAASVESSRPRLVLEARGKVDTDPMFPPALDTRPTHDTQPMYVIRSGRPTPSLSSVESDTNPDPMPPPGVEAQREAKREAQAFLQKFVRPLRPPTSPTPAQGASSDGRRFVAHYTETRPVPRTHRHEPAPGVLVRLGELARAPIVNPLPESYGPVRDGLTSPSRRRRFAKWKTITAISIGVMLLGAFIVWRVLGEPTAATGPTATSTATTSKPEAIAIPPSNVPASALPPVASSPVVVSTPFPDAPTPTSTRLPQRAPVRPSAVPSTSSTSPRTRASQFFSEAP